MLLWYNDIYGGGVVKVTMHGAIPVKQADGSWKVVEEEHEADVPDLGREHLMCNICGFGGYPECMERCKAYLPADEQRKLHQNK